MKMMMKTSAEDAAEVEPVPEEETEPLEPKQQMFPSEDLRGSESAGPESAGPS